MSALDALAALPGVLGCSLFDATGAEIERRASAHLSVAIATGMGSALNRFSEVMDTMESSAVAGGVAETSGLYAQTETGWAAVRRYGTQSVLAFGHGVPSTHLNRILEAIGSRVTGRSVAPTLEVERVEEDLGPPVGLETLRLLISVLQVSLGPAARPAVIAELKRMRETPQTLPIDLYVPLVERLTARIANPAWRTAFRERALALV